MTSRSASEPLKYKLRIKDSAEKEWLKLPIPIRDAFKKKLAERLINPRVEKDKLSSRLLQDQAEGRRLPARLQSGRRATGDRSDCGREEGARGSLLGSEDAALTDGRRRDVVGL